MGACVRACVRACACACVCVNDCLQGHTPLTVYTHVTKWPKKCEEVRGHRDLWVTVLFVYSSAHLIACVYVCLFVAIQFITICQSVTSSLACQTPRRWMLTGGSKVTTRQKGNDEGLRLTPLKLHFYCRWTQGAGVVVLCGLIVLSERRPTGVHQQCYSRCRIRRRNIPRHDDLPPLVPGTSTLLAHQ